MTNPLPMPSDFDLKWLPVHLIILYGTRSARRVQPLFRLPDSVPQMDRIRYAVAIDDAIHTAEIIAGQIERNSITFTSREITDIVRNTTSIYSLAWDFNDNDSRSVAFIAEESIGASLYFCNAANYAANVASSAAASRANNAARKAAILLTEVANPRRYEMEDEENLSEPYNSSAASDYLEFSKTLPNSAPHVRPEITTEDVLERPLWPVDKPDWWDHFYSEMATTLSQRQ